MARAATSANNREHQSTVVKAEARLTRGQAAERLGVSRMTIRRAEEAGQLEPFTDARGVTRYRVSELLRFAAKRERKRDLGAIAAYAFQLFRAGKRLDEVVIELSRTPEQVRELHSEWLKMKDADPNVPVE